MTEAKMFEIGEFVVYPAHGVGKILGIQQEDISGIKIEVIVIAFEKEKMTLRVPINKIQDNGIRSICSKEQMDNAIAELKSPTKIRRMMWSRRAQEYEMKINSGDPLSIAQVVRDLHRSSEQPERSYSERQLYQAALDRLIREYAAVENIEETEALHKLEQLLTAA